MEVEKKEERGHFNMATDKKNLILTLQWVDSKVVSVMTSLSDTSVTKV